MSDEELDKNVYYLALSGVQKAIRRNRVDIALINAAAAHTVDPRRLHSRLWTILGEDCGRNKEALHKFWKWRGNNRKFEDIVPLITALAEGPKSHDCSCLSGIIADEDEEGVQDRSLYKNFEIGQKWEKFNVILQTQKRIAAQDMENDDLDFAATYDLHDFDYNDDWILNACQFSLRYDRECKLWAAPILHMNGVRREEKLETREDPSEFELYEGVVPLSALDYHTRPGSFALGVFLKRHGEKILSVIAKDDFRHFVFWNDSWCKSNCDYYPTDWWKIWLELIHEDLVASPEARNLYDEEVRKPLNEIRKWVLYKTDFSNLAGEITKRANDVLGKI